jgi:SsrA-binding protein
MILLINKKARFEYEILRQYQAGVVLSGAEAKSLRLKSGSLSGTFVKILGDQAYLLNSQITPYKYADNRDYDPKRTRKLLLHKKELIQLQEAMAQKGQTLVPLSFELVGRHIKLNVGIGRGKKQYERRAELRKKAVERDIAREVKEKVRLR